MARRTGRLGTQAGLFALVGIASTLAYAVLFLALRQAVSAQAANVLALMITAVANPAVNRRFTFGVRGSEGAGRHHVQALLVFGAALVLTSGSLALLEVATSGAPQHAVEVVVLTLANLAATVLRFTSMRWWIFRQVAA